MCLLSITTEWSAASTFDKVNVVQDVLKVEKMRQVTKPKQLLDVLIQIASFFGDHKNLYASDLIQNPVQFAVPILIRIVR